jgi:hypothetical protein
LITGFVRLPLTFALASADDLPRLRVAVALSYPGRILAIDETVLFDAANRHLDDAFAVLPDDRFFGDDVGDILADRLANLLAMSKSVTGSAVAALCIGRAEWAEDRFRNRHNHP